MVAGEGCCYVREERFGVRWPDTALAGVHFRYGNKSGAGPPHSKEVSDGLKEEYSEKVVRASRLCAGEDACAPSKRIQHDIQHQQLMPTYPAGVDQRVG